MGEWIIGITTADYIGTTIGIHAPIPPFPPKHQGASLAASGLPVSQPKSKKVAPAEYVRQCVEEVQALQIAGAFFPIRFRQGPGIENPPTAAAFCLKRSRAPLRSAR